MKYVHISDEEIQDFLDGNFMNEAKQVRIENHLNSCDICLSNLNKYKSLYHELDYSIDIGPPEKFSDNLMNKIVKENLLKRRFFKLFKLIWPIISLTLSFLVIIYYHSFSQLNNMILKLNNEINSIIKESYKEIISYFPLRETSPTFLFYIIFLLIMLYFFDRFLVKTRNKY